VVDALDQRALSHARIINGKFTPNPIEGIFGQDFGDLTSMQTLAVYPR
jgi:hypothetical protein